jgi:hypothetical protein
MLDRNLTEHADELAAAGTIAMAPTIYPHRFRPRIGPNLFGLTGILTFGKRRLLQIRRFG